MAEFARDYLGLKASSPQVREQPSTDPLSGADVYRIIDGNGKTIAVYKVLNKNGAPEVMRELGAESSINGLGLDNSSAVKPLGAFRVGQNGRVGYMMEAAEGRDVYDILRDVGQSSDHAEALAKAESGVSSVAKAVAEMHTKAPSGSSTPADRTAIVDKSLKTLDALRTPDGKRSWTITDEVYQ